MKTLRSNNTYLLEISLGELYHETNEWLSEIDFWRIELAYFRKLISNYEGEFENNQQADEIDHFTELVDYYKNRLLKEIKVEIEKQNHTLKALLEEKPAQNEEKYREEHRKLGKMISTFKDEVKNFKKEFLNFIEKAIK